MRCSVKQLIARGLIGIVVASGLIMAAAPLAVTQPAYADALDKIRQGADTANPGGGGDLGEFFNRIVNAVIFVVGAVAVLMIIIGALRYVLSGGDPSGTKSAKDTILYAVIGLAVAVAAYAIVNFVLTQLESGGSGGDSSTEESIESPSNATVPGGE